MASLLSCNSLVAYDTRAGYYDATGGLHMTRPARSSHGGGRITREVTLPVGRQQVWEALTDAARLSSWFGAHVELEPRPGGRASFRWDDGRERGAVVEESDSPRRFSFRWLPFERDSDGVAIPRGSGRVMFELEEADGGTRLVVTESGPVRPDLPPDLLDEILAAGEVNLASLEASLRGGRGEG
jgi:uncharacterized protein YndB with AHSA1/START domain